MTLTGKVEQFNLEFEYELQSSLIDKLISSNPPKYPKYTIIDTLKNHKLQEEETFKHKLENSITNHLNQNINKLPYDIEDTEKLTYLIGFDYKSIPSRLEDIVKIDHVNIINMTIIYDEDIEQYVLDLTINTWYIDKDDHITKLLPVRPNTRLEVVLPDLNKKLEIINGSNKFNID